MTSDSPSDSTASSELQLRGSRIATDDNGNVCLNDLWRLAGEPDNKRARDWRRYAGTKALMAALVARIVGNTHNSAEAVEAALYFSTGKGQAARTYAHPVLALAYAEVLNDDLGIEVRETFLRYRAKDVTLALEIVEGMTEQAEYDELRVKLRQLVKDHNKMSAGAAKDAGVRNFEAYNGAGLNGLYGGKNKAQLLRHKGLPEDAHHLDHAGHEELPPTTSRRRRPPRNSSATALRDNRRPMRRTARWVPPCVKRSRTWAGRCPRMSLRSSTSRKQRSD